MDSASDGEVSAKDRSRKTASGRPRRILLFGLFGQGNLGNDATLIMALHELRRRLGSVEFICASQNLPNGIAEFDVRLVPLDPLHPKGIWKVPTPLLRNAYCSFAYVATEPWRRRRMLRELEGVDELIVVGTGVLDDFGMLPWDLPAWVLRWSRYARQAGARVNFLAVGAGPIRNPINRALMLEAVRQAHRRSYRDKVSKEFIAGLKIPTESDPVVPDLVFGIGSEFLPTKEVASHSSTTIGIGVMGYYGWKNDPSLGQETFETYVEKVSQFVCRLLQRGISVRLLIGELPADLPAVDGIKRRASELYGSQTDALVAAPIDSLDSLLAEISRCDAVVASRYHNVICSLVLGKPVIALGYASKFQSLMTDVGIGEYCRDIESFTVDELSDLFSEMMESHEAVVERIRSSTERYRGELAALYESDFPRS